MVCRKKMTIFLDAKEDTQILEVKKMIAGRKGGRKLPLSLLKVWV